MDTWDQDFAARSPMFDPLQPLGREWVDADWPATDQLTGIARSRRAVSGGGQPLHFVCMTGQPAPAAADYELRIHDEGLVPLRTGNWHDFFNAAAWLTFPCTKAALNRAHVAELRLRPAGKRNRRRDALTLFDESGVVVISSSRTVLDGIRNFAWQRVFWEQREMLIATTRFIIFGHALYEKALAPYVGMTGHALLLEAAESGGHDEINSDDADALAALALSAQITQPGDLSPLPVLGVPGWWHANQDSAFYDNTAYFRAGRTRTLRDQGAK